MTRSRLAAPATSLFVATLVSACLALPAIAQAPKAAPEEKNALTPPEFRLGDNATPIRYEAKLAIDPKDKQFSGEIKVHFKVERFTTTVWMNATNLEIESIDVKQGDRTFSAKARKINDDIIALDAWDDVAPMLAPRTAPEAGVAPPVSGAAAAKPATEAAAGGFTIVSAPMMAPSAPTQVPSNFSEGIAVATIRYRGQLEALGTRGLFKQQDGGDWYVVSQFEALHARRAFPCFDEPGWKTPWQLTIEAPKDMVVVSNTPELAAYDSPTRPGWRLHGFAPTKPLPSYLIALAVGPFDVVDGGTAGMNKTRLRYFAPKGRGNELTWVKESTPKVLELLENYFGSPYPFEKLDSVTIPQTIGFGAMENVGMITYNAGLMLAKPHEETTAFKRRYASIAGHEIAHQWFGNLVTPAWWDDIWLNEAFATWMAEKVLYQFKPKWDDGWFRAFARAQAIQSDKLSTTRKVKNPVVAKGDVMAAFDRITYQKGGQVLSMFESWLTPEQFREGVRNYMKRHAYGTATSQDFFRAIGEAAGKRDDALKAFTAFIEQPGVPLVDVSLQCTGKNIGLKVSQQRLRPAGSSVPDMQWTTPACFRYGQGGKVETQCLEVNNTAKVVPLANAKACPDWVLGNANGAGYYVTRYDTALEKKLTTNVARLPEQEAVALLSDAALRAESGLMPVDAALEWAAANIRHPSPVVKRQAVSLLYAQRDVWLNPKQLKRKQDIVKKELLPLAVKLGWKVKPNEDERTRSLRIALLPAVSDMARGDRESEALRLEARALALTWLEDHTRVDGELTEALLNTAGRFADRATHDKLSAALLATENRRDQRYLGSALALTRDPQVRKATFDLMLAKDGAKDKLNGRDVLFMLNDALEDEANRSATFAFFRANFDAFSAKLPQDTAGQAMQTLSRLCTKDDRAQFVAFFKDRAPKFLGGMRRYDQALERIDLCIAARDSVREVARVVPPKS